MRRIIAGVIALAMAFSMAACQKKAEPVVQDFCAEYEIEGTTSAGKPKNDTFIFEGKTTDGIITELNFDVIRNKGLEGEYSKKGIMGYQMNVSDAKVEGSSLTLGINSYTDDLSQYMVSATTDKLTRDTTFAELEIVGAVRGSYSYEKLDIETAIEAYKFLADELGITLSPETKVVDLLAGFGLAENGTPVDGAKRISFAGLNGGRSYGEQIDAIAAYILANNMTLEDVYNMFRTVNQKDQPITERDAIAGATIEFVGDFSRMAYLAAYGEIFEGVVAHSQQEGGTRVEVVTQGFGGEIETYVTFDSEGKIVSVKVRDAKESDDVGAKLYAEGSEFLTALADTNGEAEAVAGATVTSDALNKAVKFAVEYYNSL